MLHEPLYNQVRLVMFNNTISSVLDFINPSATNNIYKWLIWNQEPSTIGM